MSFDNPRLLFFLLPVFLYIPFAVGRFRKCREGAALFAAAAPSGERESLFRELRLRMVIADVFFLLFVCFLVIALAGPRWGVRIIADYRRGVDVVLAFDLSGSMNVRDCPAFPGEGDAERAPERGAVSRLERGIGIAREIAASLGDVRLGAAIGKGRGVVAVPLTYDSETLLTFLGSMDSLSLSGRGTNLESLINAAALSFQDSIPSRRAIILFSDGEALSGSFESAAEKTGKEGITLSVAGLGSERGGPVPVEKSGDAPEGFLLDPEKNRVISAREESFLRNAAEKNGGVYVDGSRGNAAETLVKYVNSLSAESRLSGHRREANPRWRIFVLAAMVSLGGARIMGFSRRGKRRDHAAPRDRFSLRRAAKDEWGGKKGGRSLPFLLCLTLFLASSCGGTQGKLLVMEGNFFNARGFHTEAIASYLKALDYEDAAPYAEYGLGAAYFALEEGTAALERYTAAGDGLSGQEEAHLELRYRIQYNTGIIRFEKGEYAEAAAAFREALKIDGSRIEAKRNLELSLLTVSRTSSPQAAPEGTSETSGGGTEADNSALFEYLRQKEQEQWKSREWSGEDDYSGPDY